MLSSFGTCLVVRLLLTVCIWYSFDNEATRSVGAVLSLLGVGALLFKYHTYHEGQLATVNKNLRVTWDHMRPMHVATLSTLALSFYRNEQVIGTFAFGLDTVLSAYVHQPRKQVSI